MPYGFNESIDIQSEFGEYVGADIRNESYSMELKS